MKVYKLVTVRNGLLTSWFVTGEAQVVYAIDGEIQLVEMSLAFDTLKHAKIYLGYGNIHSEIWEAECESAKSVGKIIDCIYDVTLMRIQEWLNGRLLSHQSMYAPTGTVLCKNLRLTKRVSDDMG